MTRAVYVALLLSMLGVGCALTFNPVEHVCSGCFSPYEDGPRTLVYAGGKVFVAKEAVPVPDCEGRILVVMNWREATKGAVPLLGCN